MGYTSSISTAVWVSDPANSAIKNVDGADIFGRGLPGEIWQRFINSYLQNTRMEMFPPFKLIGPPPRNTRSPAWRTHERRNTDPFAPPQRDLRDTDPFAPPQPDFQNSEPTPEEPSTRPARPQRSNCYPFCQNPAPDNEDLGR